MSALKTLSIVVLIISLICYGLTSLRQSIEKERKEQVDALKEKLSPGFTIAGEEYYNVKIIALKMESVSCSSPYNPSDIKLVVLAECNNRDMIVFYSPFYTWPGRVFPNVGERWTVIVSDTGALKLLHRS